MQKIFLIVLIKLLAVTLSAAQSREASSRGKKDSSSKTVTAFVADAKGTPLVGVSVIIKGTTNGAVTISDGSFSLRARLGDIMEISSIGYATRQVLVSTENIAKIVLSDAAVNLDEILITGYVAQRVKEITGSVTVVKPKELTAVPAGQVEQMLQGRVAGLNVITSGMPGGASNVRLHGIENFGDVTPLYIIDGVQGNINSLNPADIESLQVLKDAGAYSIYGVRGANGVIVVTTRTGKEGKTKISYDFYAGTTRPLKGLSVLKPQELAELTWLAKRNSGDVNPSTGNPVDIFYGSGAKPVLPDFFLNEQDVRGYFQGDPAVNPANYNVDFTIKDIYQITAVNKVGTEWFHEVFKPAFSQDHTVSVSGGNQKNKYLLSLGYLDHQGTLLNTHLKRYTARLNTVFQVNERIRVGENLQLSYRDNPKISLQQGLYTNSYYNDIFNTLISQPMLPVYDIKGGWAHFDPLGFTTNPVAQRTSAKDNKSRFWEMSGNVYAEADLLNHFTFRTSFGGSLVNKYAYNYSYNTYYPRPDSLPDNRLTESSGYERAWTFTNTIRFTRALRKHHNIKALAGVEAVDNYNREILGTSIGFFSNDINYRFLTNGAPKLATNASFATASTLYSIIGELDYGFKDKFFFKTTVRRDGSSVFGPQNRFGWFPSFSAAWRITEEKLMQKLKWLTDLKLRASWGKTGFYGNTNPYNQYTLYGGSFADAYYDIYGTSNSAVRGFRAIRIGDPRTGWEEDAVTNIGFESVLWNGKLNVTADWYFKKAKGLLFRVTLPDILGGAQPPNTNVGVVRNKGYDLLVGAKGSLSKDWHWDATLTLSAYRNKVVRLTDIPFYGPNFDASTGPVVRNEVGRPIGSFYGYKAIGLFQDSLDVAKSPAQNSAAPGRLKYFDANGDGEISDRDRIQMGNPNPKFTLGLNIGFVYKNFDFSTLFYGSFGNDVLNLVKKQLDFYPATSGGSIPTAKSKALLYNSWTPQRSNASVPIAETNINFSTLATPSSYFLENGSYLRNRSLILGYTLPQSVRQRIKIESVRMYMQVVNLFTVTSYSGLDPELSGQSDAFGIDFGNYPNNQKQYVLGFNINF